MSAKCVLIISPSDDIHGLVAKERIHQLYGDSVSCFIFDAATYPLTSSLNARLDHAQSTPLLEIASPLVRDIGPHAGQLLNDRANNHIRTEIPLGPETAVWWRRYRQSLLHPDVVEPEFKGFCGASLKSTLLGAISTCKVYNAYDDEQRADRKLHQLVIAGRCGLSVPRTLISNDLRQIEAFISTVHREGKRVIYKHAASLSGFGMPTRVFDDEARDRLDAVKYAPTIFQEEVVGSDLRIAIVGSQMFCCEWRGLSSDRRSVDIRLADGLKMYPCPMPLGLSTPLLDFQNRLNLDFGIYDFKADETGRSYFLEVNPSGQWLDMEINGGQRVSESLARLLVEGPLAEITPQGEPFLKVDLDRLFRGLGGKVPSEWVQVV